MFKQFRIYCLRYRPAVRQPQMIDTGMSHIGFRCIVRTVEAPRQEEVAREIIRQALVHPQVPWHAEAVAGCALLYVVSPIQITPVSSQSFLHLSLVTVVTFAACR